MLRINDKVVLKSDNEPVSFKGNQERTRNNRYKEEKKETENSQAVSQLSKQMKQLKQIEPEPEPQKEQDQIIEVKQNIVTQSPFILPSLHLSSFIIGSDAVK